MTQHDHPEELLAGYADGTLTDPERAVVEAHLSSCARCRQESALAMRAVATLRELPEEPVPFGVMNPVTAEIGRRMARPARWSWGRRIQWAAGAAVAAAFVAVIAISVLPNVGGRTTAGGAAGAPEAATSATTARAAASGAEPSRPVALERQDVNYDDPALAALAADTARSAARGSADGSQDTAAAGPSEGADATRSASTCLARGADVGPLDRLVRLIRARYEGRPALIGVYLEAPAADRPADTVLIWVVGSEDCGFLSFTQQRI